MRPVRLGRQTVRGYTCVVWKHCVWVICYGSGRKMNAVTRDVSPFKLERKKSLLREELRLLPAAMCPCLQGPGRRPAWRGAGWGSPRGVVSAVAQKSPHCPSSPHIPVQSPGTPPTSAPQRALDGGPHHSLPQQAPADICPAPMQGTTSSALQSPQGSEGGEDPQDGEEGAQEHRQRRAVRGRVAEVHQGGLLE